MAFFIPPNQDRVIHQILGPGAVPLGWRIDSIDWGEHQIRARVHGERGGSFEVLLSHVSQPGDGSRTLSFRVHGTAPLNVIESVAASARQHEAGFRWLDALGELALDEYLELTPYVDLEEPFDHEACLSEAMALLDRFVMYTADRRYRVQHWRGLALRAPGGDPSKVAVPTAPDSSYALTPIVDQCPRIMEMLSRVLDLDRGAAVNLLMLDPRGNITPHSDDTSHETMRSVNVALNMPPGCQFFLDVLPDGKHHRYTTEVPFKAGSAMLLNVARHHYVVNPSNTPRIHVVARCPPRKPVAEVLQTALRQSSLQTVENMRAALGRKYLEQNRPAVSDAGLERYERKPLGGRPALQSMRPSA